MWVCTPPVHRMTRDSDSFSGPQEAVKWMSWWSRDLGMCWRRQRESQPVRDRQTDRQTDRHTRVAHITHSQKMVPEALKALLTHIKHSHHNDIWCTHSTETGGVQTHPLKALCNHCLNQCSRAPVFHSHRSTHSPHSPFINCTQTYHSLAHKLTHPLIHSHTHTHPLTQPFINCLYHNLLQFYAEADRALNVQSDELLLTTFELYRIFQCFVPLANKVSKR